jgi:hypothetical protein
MAIPVGLAAFLVLSNVAIFPAIFYAYVRQLFAETALLLAVLAASTAFHLCQVEWFCFGVALHALQVTDHFMVYTALVWFSLYFAGAAERTRTAITIATMAIMLPVILTFIGSWLSGGIIVAITLVLSVVVLTYAIHVYGGPPVAWGAFVVAMGLLAAGVFLHVFGGDFGPDNWKYPVAHSVWHVLSMLALYYVLGVPYRDDNALRNAHYTVGDHVRVGRPVVEKRRTRPRVTRPVEIAVTTSVPPPLPQQEPQQTLSSPPAGRRSMRDGKRISLGLHPDNIAIV